MDIHIYSKDNCPNCVKAFGLLKQYSPKCLKIGDNISRDEFINKFPNVYSVPQIVINGEHIGGYKDLERWISFQDFNCDF